MKDSYFSACKGMAGRKLRLVTAIAGLLGIALFFSFPSQPDGMSSSAEVATAARVVPPHSSHGPGHSPACQHDQTPVNALADKDARFMKISAGFLESLATADGSFSLALPDGSSVKGTEAKQQRDLKGVVWISGNFREPAPGRFFFQRQDLVGVAGKMVGHVIFDGQPMAWKVVPAKEDGEPVLKEVPIGEVLCVEMFPTPQAMPQDHPGNPTVPNPPYQAVIPLQSLPGATGVIYLDFDGEKGPFPGWYDGDVGSFGYSNETIRDTWIRVAEDFLPFNLNVTTDVKVYQAAPEGQRIRCIITSTNFFGSAGVAWVGAFNWGGEQTCWAFIGDGEVGVTVISHEVGHALGLYHHGIYNGEYYGGHGNGVTSWAPIMGNGVGANLKQWSRGDYLSATKPWQDDLNIITTTNNGVTYRSDDAGDSLSSAAYLNIATGGSVTNQQGIIGRTGEVDAFRFKTSGGAVNLMVKTSDYAPNLDILAELVNASTGVLVSSFNPADQLHANVVTTLPAGEYLLKITGTGFGSPGDLTGYSNYGSLGSYRIDGTVTNGETQQSLTVAENSSNGTSVGTVAAKTVTGTLTYSLSSGNTDGAFSLDAGTGVLTVANSAALNYESLSTRWDDPADIELFVGISNTTGGSETVRVRVSVSDVNERPSISGGGDLTIIENTRAGIALTQVSGSDPDRFDIPVFSIVSGNSSGFFTIDSGTGRISTANPPVVAADTVFSLGVQATDKNGLTAASPLTVNITVRNLPGGLTLSPGGLYRTFFEGIGGSAVADLTGHAKFPNTPDREIFLTSFDGGGYGDNYGSTLRGYLIPPTTGSYQFWVASDDASQLILGPNSTPVSSPVIASIQTWTGQYAWDAQSSGASAGVALTAGQPYYIELRHKEGGGGDHAAVAWSGPGISRQVISGMYLAPLDQNYAPRPNGSLGVAETAAAGTSIGRIPVADVNAEDAHADYTILSGNEAGLFSLNASTGMLTLTQAGQFNVPATLFYDLTISVADNGSPALSGTGVVRVNVIPNTLYFDPNGTTAGSVANGGNYSWLGNYWTGATDGVSAVLPWQSGASAKFAATDPGSPLAYNVSIAGYNTATHGSFTGIEALAGTVTFTGAVGNFYLTSNLNVRAATDAALNFNQTSSNAELAFNLNNFTASFDGNVAFNNGGMGNAGNVVVNSGALTLYSASRYTGNTTINGGTLRIPNGGSIYNGAYNGLSVVTVNSGGTLELHRWGYGPGAANMALGGLDYNPARFVINGGTVRCTGGSSAGPTDPVESPYGPGFTIGASGATLEAAAPGDTWTVRFDSRGLGPIASNSGGTLTLSGAGNGLFDKELGGTGALVKEGAGTWTLNRANTYAGNTTVNQGTLEITSTASLPGPAVVSAGTGNGAAVLFLNVGNTTWSRNISGGGRLKVATTSGSQITSLTGNYSSLTGTLEVASGSGKIQLATATSYPAASATLQLNANTSAFISGAGTFAPKIHLYGSSIGEPAFGQLRIANASSTTLSGAVTLFANSSIAVDTSRAATLSGVISESGGSFGFTKNQPGTLTLSEANTYSGGTTVNDGVLRTGTSSGSFGIGDLTIAAGKSALVRHTNGGALGRQAYVSLLGTTGTLSIASGATERVARLYLNGVRQVDGTYQNTARIIGGGQLIVGETAPGAPASLTASAASATGIHLEWIHASVNDTAIKVERSLAPDSGFTEVATLAGNARNWSDSGLIANTAYFYRILAVNSAGNSGYSTVATATTLAPSQPIDFTATPGNAQVSLSWTASSGAASYIVSRATTSGGPYTQVGFPASTTYVDSGLLYDTTYYYVVSAVAGNAVSAQSAEVSAMPLFPDGNGVWSAASGGNWTDATQWQNQTVAKGSGFTATFPLAAGGTITQNRADLTIGQLAFSNGNYTIAGNRLTLDVASGTPGISVANGVTANIGSALSGADGLEKSGPGMLVLSGPISYTGGTTVGAGTLALQNNYATTAFTIASGALLHLDMAASRDFGTTIFSGTGTLRKSGVGEATWGASAATFAMSSGSLIDVQAGGRFVGGSNANENWTNNKSDLNVASGALFDTVEANVRVNRVTGAGTLRTGYGGAGYQNLTVGVDGGGSQFDGVIANSATTGNLVKEGSGTIHLSAVNTYTGTTVINGGVLAISGQSGGTGGIRGSVTVSSGGELRATGSSGAVFGYTTGQKIDTFNIIGGTVNTSVGSNHIWNATVNLTGGTLKLDSNTSNSPTGAYYEWGNTQVNTLASTDTSTISGRIRIRADVSPTLTFTVADGAAATDLLVSAAITESGSSGIAKAGPGTLFLSGTNHSYSGVTTIAGGRLNAATFSNYGVAGSLGNRALDAISNVGILFRGGTLQYTGSTAQSTNRGIRLSTTGGGGTIDASGSIPSATLSFTATSSADLFENPGPRALTLTGSNTGANIFVMLLADQASNKTSLIKSGAGRWVLSGSNTYTGATTVNGGTLAINGSLASGSAVTVGGASATGTPTLSGNGTVNGPVTINAASGGAAGTLNPGSVGATGQLSTGSATIHGTLAIDLNAGNSDKLVVTGNLNIATATIDFNSIIPPTASSYDIASYTGNLDATAFATVNNLPPGYQLQFDATNKLIQLVQSLSAYDSWTTTTHGLSGVDAGFDADPDNDGIRNGLEWILGGNPNSSSPSITPAATFDASDNLVITFTRLEASINETTLKLEYGTDLSTWPGQVTIGAISSGPDANGVSVSINTTASPDAVTVTIPASNATSGRIFTRLNARK